MKFKKFFAVLSAASMIASVAAVNASADDAAPYSFEYEMTTKGAVVKNVTFNAVGVQEIEIPEVNEDGIKVIGVKDFAFLNADVSTIVCPDTFKLENIGSVAFVTDADISAVAEGETKEDALVFAANTVKFMDKDNWKGDEEELQPAATVFENVANTIGADEDTSTGEFVKTLYTYADTDAIVRAEDEDTLEKMSQKSYDGFKSWVKTIPVHVTLKASEGTDVQKYAEGKALVDVNFEVNEPEEEHLIGDANQDGEVNVRDCATIAKAMANKDKFDKIITCTICADYNKDGEVNVRDAAALAHDIATGKIDTSKK